MGKGEYAESKHHRFTWDDVREHDSATDKWIVINDDVYNISEWAKRHPGGYRVINNYAGQDATVSLQFLPIFSVFMSLHFIISHKNIQQLNSNRMASKCWQDQQGSIFTYGCPK